MCEDAAPVATDIFPVTNTFNQKLHQNPASVVWRNLATRFNPGSAANALLCWWNCSSLLNPCGVLHGDSAEDSLVRFCTAIVAGCDAINTVIIT